VDFIVHNISTPYPRLCGQNTPAVSLMGTSCPADTVIQFSTERYVDYEESNQMLSVLTKPFFICTFLRAERIKQTNTPGFSTFFLLAEIEYFYLPMVCQMGKGS
jgi:hypothetical protein